MVKSNAQMIVSKDGTVGSNLKRLRKAHGWSQLQLVAELQLLGSSVSRETLSKIEHGRNIKAEDLVAVKIALETTFEELFAGVLPSKETTNDLP